MEAEEDDEDKDLITDLMSEFIEIICCFCFQCQLLTKWQGSYHVVKKVGRVNYLNEMDD